MKTLFRFAGGAPLALILMAGRAPGVSMTLDVDARADDCGETPAFDPSVLDLAPGDESQWEEWRAAPEATPDATPDRPEVARIPERGARAA